MISLKNNTQSEVKEVSSSLKNNTQKSKSRILCPIALLVLVAGIVLCFATSASAAEVTASGTCGDALTWELTDDGVLTISGTGAMTDYSSSTSPWYNYRTSITSVVISDGVTSIGAYGFYSCKQLASVSLPDSLTTLGKSAFVSCSNLSSIAIPSGVTAIPDYCFDSTGLVSFVFPDGLLSIGNGAFSDCNSLVSVDIPSSVTSLGYRAFYCCAKLAYVYLHSDTPPSFGTDVFNQYSTLRSLRAIYVPNYDAYMATSLGTNYADVIYAYGDEPYSATINWDDYYLGLTPGDDVVTYSYSFSLRGYDSSASVKYCVLPGNSSIVQYNQLTKATYALDLRDKLVDSLAVSALATFKYSAAKSSSYTSDGVDLVCRYYDDTGYFISSESLEIYGGKMPSGDNTLSKEVSLTPPDGAAYLMAWLYVSHSGQTYTSSSSELVLSFDYEPVPIPVEPEVTDDFGGEVNYLRGQAATPLSVTATVTDGGTLSYQWYYIDSENVDVAVAIDGATGTSYTPDTRSVGSRYYYCIVTNTLGELTASMYSDYAYVTVTRPELGDGYDIYDYKDYVTGTEVSGTNKVYYVTFPMQGFYTAEYGGYNSDRQLLDYFIGTEMLLNCPPTDSEDDNYYIRLDYYPLGMGSQPNLLKLSNIPVGTQAGFEMIVGNDSDQGSATMVFLWYDSDGYYVAKTEYTVTSAFNDDLQAWVYVTDFIFTPPAEAAYCAYYLSVDGLRPESNFDQYLTIRSAEFYLTISTLDDIQGSVDDVGDKVDQVGDKIDQVGGEIIDGIGETNDKLDDLITGGEAGDSATDSSDALKDKTDEAGSAIGDYKDTMDSLPEVPDNIGGVLNDDDINISIDVMGGIMNWEQSGLVAMYAPMTMVLAVAFLCYVVFGKRG